MSVEKSTATDVQPRKRPPERAQGVVTAVRSDADTGFMSLEIEDVDFGGDPYNNTGQYCQLELKDRE